MGAAGGPFPRVGRPAWGYCAGVWWGASPTPAHEYARVMRRFRVSAICARPLLLEELAKEPLAPLDQVRQAVVDAAELGTATAGGAHLEPRLLRRLGSSEHPIRLMGGLGAA